MARPPVGDQSVFADIHVRIRISGYDAVDPSLQLSGALVVNEPLLFVLVDASVQVNGGDEASRVPGLRVFADGFEVSEIASGAQVPEFEFPFQLPDAAHGESLELELRLDAASYFLEVAPPVVELTAPASGTTLPADQPLALQWTGTASAPRRASVIAREAGCVIAFRQTAPATFVPERQEYPGQHEPPCKFEAFAEWSVPAPPPASPFASLQLERVTARRARFTVS